MSDVTKVEPPSGKVRRKCVFCQHETAHKIWAQVFEREDVTPEHARNTNYQTIQCQGCEKLYFQINEMIVCMIDPEEQIGSELDPGEAYPPPLELREPSPLVHDQGAIPCAVWQLYLEALSAIELSLPTLAGLGFRAVVEAVGNDMRAEGTRLHERIEWLAQRGVLTAEGARTLHGLRLVGNAAAHEAAIPSQDQLLACKAVVDHVLNAAYVLPAKVGVLLRQGPGHGRGGRTQ